MKSKIHILFVILVIGTLLAGCAGRMVGNSREYKPQTFAEGQYTAKVDNVLFILDSSSTMARSGERNLVTAKNLVGAVNQSLPGDLTFNAGLRTFGYPTQKSEKMTELVYGMTEYSREGLQKGLDGVTYAGGTSPLPKAIQAAGEDLRGAHGKSALIIVSDGLAETGMSGAPAALAKLKGDMGNKLCTYTIAVGSDPAGEKLLRDVAQADGCGLSESAASLAAPGNLKAFVNTVFLDEKKRPVAVAAPVVVAAPVDGDDDGDGVANSRDKCPSTPRGEIVDEDGCTLKLTLHVNFDFDKSDIKPEFATDLKTAGDFIIKNKDVPYILIEGFTDSVGEEAYNQKLSERRAAAVRQYLIDNFDIKAKRLVARGGGESLPVADNGTEAGRAENRRVEIICCAIISPDR
jgi:OOP family OmpA-OmpF porin